MNWTAGVKADPCHCVAKIDRAWSLGYVYPKAIYTVHDLTRSTVFKTNRSQAVRLPKAVAFPEEVHQVEITVVGSSRIITPVGKRWDDLFDSGPRASEDFMRERVQPPAQEREPL